MSASTCFSVQNLQRAPRYAGRHLLARLSNARTLTLMIYRLSFLATNPNGVSLGHSKGVLDDPPLAFPNINSLPAKQPAVAGPCAGSKHNQAYSESRKQEVHGHCVS